MWRSESKTEMLSSQEETLRTVRKLRGDIRQVETASRNDDGSSVSTGSTAMDQLLPAGGYSRGIIVEWLAGRGSGVDYLSLLGARNAAADGGAVVIVDAGGINGGANGGTNGAHFYPPAARALGIKLSNLIVLRAFESGTGSSGSGENGSSGGPGQWMIPGQSKSRAKDGMGGNGTGGEGLCNDDLLWAIDQSLRCSAVAAVWGTLPAFDSLHAERTWLRRFQLSAETSGCTGFFIRPTRLAYSSWAEVQWKLDPLASTADCRRARVTLSRCQGGIAGQSVDVEINSSTGEINTLTGNVQEDGTRTESQQRTGKPASAMPLAAKLANPTPRRRSARA